MPQRPGTPSDDRSFIVTRNGEEGTIVTHVHPLGDPLTEEQQRLAISELLGTESEQDAGDFLKSEEPR